MNTLCPRFSGTPSPRVRFFPFRNASTNAAMRLLLAIFLPFLAFFTIGRPIAGIVCLILQVTLIGWLPAAIWAVYALGQYKTDKKIEAALGGHRR
jgi:uncharacterized membrane protein YqaE (UPF0057 family)